MRIPARTTHFGSTHLGGFSTSLLTPHLKRRLGLGTLVGRWCVQLSSPIRTHTSEALWTVLLKDTWMKTTRQKDLSSVCKPPLFKTSRVQCPFNVSAKFG